MKRKPLSIRQDELGKKSPSCWPIYSLVSTVAIGCYLNGLNGDFVHDDIPAVTLNKDVLAVNPLKHVLRNDFWGTPMADLASHKSYRPLTTLTFRVNYLLFGLQPLWFHVTNVGLHVVACILFTRISLSIAGLRPPFATLAGLVFAVHPVHTEAVTGIVGRADVLACIFFLFSLIAYHGCSDGECHIWLSIVSGGLSMLAKETGITVFMVNLFYDLYLHFPSVKKSLTETKWSMESNQFLNRAAKILTSLGILLILRLAILQGSLPKFSQQDNPAAFHPSFHVRFLTFCYLAAFNWWIVLCPATLSHDWQMGSISLITSLSDSRNLVSCFFIGMVILLASKSLGEFETQRHSSIVLGFTLLFLPFLPATNLLVTVGFVVAERVLYIPSLGSILLTIYGFQLLWLNYTNHRQLLACLITTLLIMHCFRTTARNRDWLSRESLLRSGLITLPHNAKMHYNYANFLRDSSRIDLAQAHYQTALKLWPSYASAHNNLGTLLNNEQKAEQHFLAAIRYSSDHINAHYNLGKLYRKSNRTSESEKLLLKCLTLDPSFIPVYIELARIRGPNDPSNYQLMKTMMDMKIIAAHYVLSIGNWLLENEKYHAALYFYWGSLRTSHFQQEVVLATAKLLRKFGWRTKLFQLIIRWHYVRRRKRGELPLRPDAYLQDWLLKSQLNIMIKAYHEPTCKFPCLEKDSNNTGQPTRPAIISKKGSEEQLKTTNFTMVRQSENSELSHKPNLSNTQILPHILDSLQRN